MLFLSFSIVLLSLVPAIIHPQSLDARCPNGTHKSPSGDCEKVTHSGGLPRCPDGYHRSPDGDCERVSSESSGGTRNSESKDDQNDDEDNSDERRKDTNNHENEDENEDNDADKTSFFNSGTPLSQFTECKGSADCFRGIVTEIVDGDTLDVNNVRVRLAMVNTPETGEPGYDEAKMTTESVCPVGSEALVDEDDGQIAGSFDRLIGAVYCNGDDTSLNEILLVKGKAILYEDFCDVSEFSGAFWVTNYGC
jgi:endonuclease YncB( thermonuclease family)